MGSNTMAATNIGRILQRNSCFPGISEVLVAHLRTPSYERNLFDALEGFRQQLVLVSAAAVYVLLGSGEVHLLWRENLCVKLKSSHAEDLQRSRPGPTPANRNT